MNSWFAGEPSQAARTSTNDTALLIVIVLMAVTLATGTASALLLSLSIRRSVMVVLGRMQSIEQNCMSYLQDGLRAFAAGDLTNTYEPVTPPIPAPPNDEIGQIAQAVNAIRNKAGARTLAG